MTKPLFMASAIIAGDEMEVLRNGYILVEDHVIVKVGYGQPPSADRILKNPGCVIIPGLVNAHTHIGDSAFKDIAFSGTLDELFRPPDGLKHRLLRATHRNLVIKAIRDTLVDMLRSGVITFVDFREEGIRGVKALLEAINRLKMRAIILGRLDHTFTQAQLETNKGLFSKKALKSLKALLSVAYGLAPSSPNDLTDESLKQLAFMAKRYGKLRATHVAEHPGSLGISRKRTGLTEVERALRHFEADLLVHLTYATPEDLDLVANCGASVICCPRANAALGLKLPAIPEMLERKINVALGTDNVMLNSPDMFKEMGFTMRAYSIQGLANKPLCPRDVFKMATINGAKALKIDDVTGSISEGKLADLTVLDFNTANLRHTHDPLTAVVHRVRPDDVKLVLVEGELVYERDLGVRRRIPC